MKRMQAGLLVRMGAGMLQCAGAAPQVAHRVTRLLVDAELAGHPRHGIERLSYYLEQIVQGRLVPDATAVVVSQTPASVVLDGCQGFGELALDQAVALAAGKAVDQGVAAVVIRRAHGVGRLSPFVEQLAEQGQVALLMANGMSRQPVVVPYGGAAPCLGANPVAMAVPRRTGCLALDMATCTTRSGQDPTAIQHPFGGVSAHKGYGLNLVVELLAGALTGAGCAGQSERPGHGALLLSVQVADFVAYDAFVAEVEDLLAFVRSTRMVDAAGDGALLLPGEPERMRRAESLARGLPVDPTTWERLMAAGRRVGWEPESESRGPASD